VDTSVSVVEQRTLGLDDEQRHGPRALLLVGCECGAGADPVPEDSSVSSTAGVTGWAG
jgi:hypothetical protein